MESKTPEFKFWQISGLLLISPQESKPPPKKKAKDSSISDEVPKSFHAWLNCYTQDENRLGQFWMGFQIEQRCFILGKSHLWLQHLYYQ